MREKNNVYSYFSVANRLFVQIAKCALPWLWEIQCSKVLYTNCTITIINMVIFLASFSMWLTPDPYAGCKLSIFRSITAGVIRGLFAVTGFVLLSGTRGILSLPVAEGVGSCLEEGLVLRSMEGNGFILVAVVLLWGIEPGGTFGDGNTDDDGLLDTGCMVTYMLTI